MSKPKKSVNNGNPLYSSVEYSSGNVYAKHVNQKSYDNFNARDFVRTERREDRKLEKDLAVMRATEYSSPGYGGIGSVAHAEGEKAHAAANAASAIARALADIEKAFYEMAAKIRVAKIQSETDKKLSSDKRKSSFMNFLSDERSSYYKASSDIKRDKMKYKDNMRSRKMYYKLAKRNSKYKKVGW